MADQRVLPADVYDTFEFASLAFGGIGAGAYYDFPVADPHAFATGPCCIYGLAVYAAGCDTGVWDRSIPTVNAIYDIIGTVESDRAVRAVNDRRRRPRDSRVPFDAWAKELNIVRGD